MQELHTLMHKHNFLVCAASTHDQASIEKAPAPGASSDQQRGSCSCGNPDCTCQNCHCQGTCSCGKSPSMGHKIKTKLDHGLMAVGVKKDTRPEKPSDVAWETMEQAEKDMHRREADERRAGQRVAQDAATEGNRGAGSIGTVPGCTADSARIQKAGVIGSQAAADAKTSMDRQAEDQSIQAVRQSEDSSRH